MSNYDNATNIRRLLDTTTECTQSLRNLKVNVDGWDEVLVYKLTPVGNIQLRSTQHTNDNIKFMTRLTSSAKINVPKFLSRN